jgi:hypothetical protein
MNVSMSGLQTIVIVSHLRGSIYYVYQARGRLRYSSLRQ